MSPLESRIGQYWLQLPATFGPRDLPALWQFLDTLPKSFTYGVEVRHPDFFFAKGEAEQLFNRGLHERGVNRVILTAARCMPQSRILKQYVTPSARNRRFRCMR